MKPAVKKSITWGVLVLSLILITVGILMGDPQVIWSNGKLLCLTCIGIK